MKPALRNEVGPVRRARRLDRPARPRRRLQPGRPDAGHRRQPRRAQHHRNGRFHRAVPPSASVQITSSVTGYLQEARVHGRGFVKKGDTLLDHRPAALPGGGRPGDGPAQGRPDQARPRPHQSQPLAGAAPHRQRHRCGLPAEPAGLPRGPGDDRRRHGGARERASRPRVLVIKAPISGKISRKLVTEGNLVVANSTDAADDDRRDRSPPFLLRHRRDELPRLPAREWRRGRAEVAARGHAGRVPSPCRTRSASRIPACSTTSTRRSTPPRAPPGCAPWSLNADGWSRARAVRAHPHQDEAALRGARRSGRRCRPLGPGNLRHDRRGRRHGRP